MGILGGGQQAQTRVLLTEFGGRVAQMSEDGGATWRDTAVTQAALDGMTAAQIELEVNKRVVAELVKLGVLPRDDASAAPPAAPSPSPAAARDRIALLDLD